MLGHTTALLEPERSCGPCLAPLTRQFVGDAEMIYTLGTQSPHHRTFQALSRPHRAAPPARPFTLKPP